MAAIDSDFLKDFYQALLDRPLTPDDPRYVRLYEHPPPAQVDPVAELKRTVVWSTLESVQLFSGFRGTGKSTELRRLKAELEASGENLVVLCDMATRCPGRPFLQPEQLR